MACQLAHTAQPQSAQPQSSQPGATLAPQIFQRGRAALELLLEARCFAGDLGRSAWDFAMEIDQLRSRGLLHNDLRWLICKGYLEQASEISGGVEQQRCFQHERPLTFTDTSCFILTDAGSELVQQLSQAVSSPPPTVQTRRADPPHTANERSPSPACWIDGDARPVWDRDRQELRVGSCVVKQFKVPAPNQEMVIAVFQEEGWPVRIDDPLPPRADLDPKRRLHDTINSLNRNQKTPLIRFLGDGSGQGVRWELNAAEDFPDGVELTAAGTRA